MLLYLAVPLRDDNDGCILLLYARRSSFRSMNIVLVKLDAQLLPLQASGALGNRFVAELHPCPSYLPFVSALGAHLVARLAVS